MVKGAYLLLAGGGAVFMWSGIRGKSVTGVMRALAGGQAPNTAPNALQIASITAGSNSGGGTNPGNVQAGGGNANELTVAKYLMQNGYSKAAAAGIASCIAGESGGNPEQLQIGGGGGTGLIQWTPASSSPVQPLITGNASRDLATQMRAIVVWNARQGSGLVQILNSISDPVQAADFYSQHFERPSVTNSDVRPNVAQQIFSQLLWLRQR